MFRTAYESSYRMFAESPMFLLRSFTTDIVTASKDNLPKIKPSAYRIFFAEQMKKVKDGKKVADLWKQLDPSSKRPYETEAQTLTQKLNALYPDGLPKIKREKRVDLPKNTPRSNIQLFMQEEMSALKAANHNFKKATGGTAVTDVIKAAAAKWRELPASKKEEYRVRVEALKDELKKKAESEAPAPAAEKAPKPAGKRGRPPKAKTA